MLDPENYTEEFWEQNGRVKALAGYIEHLSFTGGDEARAIAREIQAIMGFRPSCIYIREGLPDE